MDVKQIETAIKSALPGSEVRVEGDGRHFLACVVSDEFLNKTQVQQHQMVYRALGETVGKEIHALSLQTYTHSDWEKKQALSPN